MIVTELMSEDIETLMVDSSRTFTLAQRLAMAKDAALGKRERECATSSVFFSLSLSLFIL
jgi:hypothetical protein